MKKFHRILSLILAILTVFSTLAFVACQKDDNKGDNPGGDETPTPDVIPPLADTTDDNYRTFYQIFVGSFSDANGDTFGDLRGIINRMDYLNDGDLNNGNDLGVQGIWLSPIFSSPTYHKYDAKDYYKIDWRFGDHDDLKELADLCEERNVKLILDLVLNHTSGQNEWFVQFKESRMKGDTSNKYYDYYTCVTAAERVNGRNYQKIGGVDAYYEVNFSGDMPELNYDNPEVKEEMLNVAKYYLDLGVDGFRFDAVKYIYYGDAAANVEFWNWYMSELKAYKPDIYCVGECWSAESEILDYYEAINCFNFGMSGAEGQAARAARGASLSSYIYYIKSFQEKVRNANPEGIPMPFLANHDQDRIAGAFILDGQLKIIANLYLLSPGSPFIYYGEEIGIKGSRGAAMTDANRRLAMLWGDEDMVKDPVGSTYPADRQIQTTVASQLEDENSLLNHYAKVINVRTRYQAIARGTYDVLTSKNKNLAGFKVEYNGEIIYILHNNSQGEISVSVSELKGLADGGITELCEILGASASLENGVLTVAPFTSIILK